jgi:V/A-type H+-transporting ATPase subunit E
MGIEEVKKEILDNARDQAKKAIKEAEKERESILKNAESSISSIKEKLDTHADGVISQHKVMVLAEASSIIKKERLAVERALINEVFENAKKELDSLSSKKREGHLLMLLENAKKNFSFTKVYCSRADVPLLKKYNPVVADISGGVILENETGEIKVDLSYETLLDLIKQKELSPITKTLFG